MRGKTGKKSLEVHCMMVLGEAAEPLSTGQVSDALAVLAPIREERKVRHGRPIQNPHRKIAGTDMEAKYEYCPSCECTEVVELSRPYMAPRVRSALKRLAKKNLVIEIEGPVPNNSGGNLWLRADQKDEYYSKVFS